MGEPKTGIIERILELEKAMFLAVPTEGDCECKENLALFEAHRRSQYLAWSEASCASWLRDLEEAKAAGRNLMTLKYARMDGKLPPLARSPVLAELLGLMVAWQRDFLEAHARISGKARPIETGEDEGEVRSFALYLESELGTYSPRTLECLLEDARAKKAAGANMSEEIYQNLFGDLGYGSVEGAENSLGAGEPGPRG